MEKYNMCIRNKMILSIFIINMLYITPPSIEDCQHNDVELCYKDQDLLNIINNYTKENFAYDETVHYEDYQ